VPGSGAWKELGLSEGKKKAGNQRGGFQIGGVHLLVMLLMQVIRSLKEE